jgi:hypothetical protein
VANAAITAGDLDDLYAYHSRPDVVRYLYGEACDRAQAIEALELKTRQCKYDSARPPESIGR